MQPTITHTDDLSGVITADAAQVRARPRTRPLIVALTGHTDVGKDTIAGILSPQHGFGAIAFADALRREVSEAWRVDLRNLTDRAITLSVPLGTLERAPTMGRAELRELLDRNRLAIAAQRDLPRPAATDGDTARPVAADAVAETVPLPEQGDDDWRS